MDRETLLKIGKPFFWLHESLHLAAARIVGIEARLAQDGRSVFLEDLSAHPFLCVIFVVLAPAALGFIGLVIVLPAWIYFFPGLSARGHLNFFCGVWMCAGWLVGCYYDFQDIVWYIRHKEWR